MNVADPASKSSSRAPMSRVEFLDERHSLAACSSLLFICIQMRHRMGASRASSTSRRFVAYLQRLDGRQSISMRKIPAWRIVQISCGKECRVRLGQVGTAAGVIAHSFFGQSLSDSQLSRATVIHAKQSEMPIRTFFSEVHAARAPTFEDSAETEQSHWLEERGTLPYGRQAPEDLR